MQWNDRGRLHSCVCVCVCVCVCMSECERGEALADQLKATNAHFYPSARNATQGGPHGVCVCLQASNVWIDCKLAIYVRDIKSLWAEECLIFVMLNKLRADSIWGTLAAIRFMMFCGPVLCQTTLRLEKFALLWNVTSHTYLLFTGCLCSFNTLRTGDADLRF